MFSFKAFLSLQQQRLTTASKENDTLQKSAIPIACSYRALLKLLVSYSEAEAVHSLLSKDLSRTVADEFSY